MPGNYFDQFDEPQGRVFTLPPNPRQVSSDTREDERLRLAREAADRAAQAARNADAVNERAAREWNATHLPDGTPQPKPLAADDARKLATQNATMDSIVGQINRVQDLYNRDIAPENLTNLFGGIDAYGPKAGRFNSAGQGMADQGLAAFRVPGVGAQSDLEARQFATANTPQAGDWDEQIEEKLANMRRRVDANRKAQGLPPAQWTGNPQQDEQIAAVAMGGAAGGGTTLPPNPGGGAPTALSPAGGASYATPNDVAYANALQAAYNSGASVSAMLDVGRKFGVNPKLQDVTEWQRAVDYRDGTGEYKGKKRGLAEVVTPSTGRRNLVEQSLGAAANSPLGAATLSAADFGTFGLGDEIAGGLNAALGKGDYEGLRDYADFGKRALAAEYPNSSAVGSVVGGIAGGLGLESLAARGLSRLPAGAFARARSVLDRPVAGAAVDGALYGGAFGAGSNNNERLSGAAKGAFVGGVGSTLGATGMRATGGLLGGIRDGAVRRLTDAGITLSPGQMLGNSGVVGRAVKKLEDTAESIPFVGSAIRQRREEGFQDFNRAAFNEALSPIEASVGNVAEQGVEDALDAARKGYGRALDGVRIPTDKPFAEDVWDAIKHGQVEGPYASDFDRIMRDQVTPALRGAGGEISGRNLQDSLRILKGYARQYNDLASKGANGIPQPAAWPVAIAFNDMATSLEGLVARQAPEVLPAYNAANSAYRQVGVVRDAVDAAKVGTQSGEGGIFTPAQLSQAARRNAKKYGGSQGTTRQPFFELTRDAQDVLPSRVPNSGTADRMQAALAILAPTVGAGVGAQQGWIDPETAAAVAALTGAYTRTGQKAAQALLTRRPDAFRRAGEAVSNRSQYGGLLGSSLGLSLLPPRP